MALFLRDQQIRHAAIDEDALRHFATIIGTRTALNNFRLQGEDEKRAVGSYVIRFDNKGYRVFTPDELVSHFRNARVVERVVFSVETGLSMRTGRVSGTYLEVRFDAKEPNTCFFSASSDDSDWVDASTFAIQEALLKCKSKTVWLANVWTQSLVQLLGLVLVFIVSLWLASKIAPKLATEDSIIVALLFALLVLSHLWTFLNQRLMLAISRLNVRFSRPKDRWQWLRQGLILIVAAPVTIWVLGKLASGFGEILTSLIRKGPTP